MAGRLAGGSRTPKRRAKPYRVAGSMAVWVVALLALVPAASTAGSAALPDGRRYELVSPTDKNGGDVLVESTRTRAAASGGALGFASLTGFGDVHGTAISTDYIAQRGLTSWATHGITPRQNPLSSLFVFNGPGDAPFEGEFSGDLSRGVVRANAFPAGDPNVSGVQNLFLRDDLLSPGLGAFDLLTSSVAPIPPPVPDGGVDGTYRPATAGASADFGHVIFESRFNLTQQAIDAGLPTTFLRDEKLYEWDHGTVRLVGILPDAEGGGIATHAIAGRGADRISPYYTWDAISDDGSRIFFTVPVVDGAGEGQLYMRVNGTETVHLNLSELQPGATPVPATFSGATPDGSKVFFMSEATLTDQGPGGLYRYDVDAPEGERLTLISVDRDPSDGLGGRALSMAGISDDGSWVYFVGIDGRFVPGSPVPAGESRPSMYVWHDGTLQFVARLFNTGYDIYFNSTDAQWQFGPKTSRVTSDGRHLLFLTFEGGQVPPHDHGDCSAISIGAVFPCREVYVYSADANGGQGLLACASCDPAGAAGTADADVAFRANAGAARATSHLNHPLSADGRWVFFGTQQPLVADDRNTDIDVYRYEVATGDLSLISSGGADAGDSYFLDASMSGRDVFFATRERLVGWDLDASYDIYDARVDGGLPEPPVLAPPCSGQACQGSAPPPPDLRTPASAGFHGSGNVSSAKKAKAKKCKRGHVRKRVGGKVRCVKKHRRGTHAAARQSKGQTR